MAEWKPCCHRQQQVSTKPTPSNPAAGVSPPAEGDGRYEPLPGVGAVVAVVGTAHVRGITRAWGDALQDQAVAQYVE